ncbi:DUF397 domain-containing protein [Actinomadura rupiterrae]|uniref:DUF397 domain-containing protein n=1 Tax=Actinomadura rupiterrae TaxID=559627 RepID=UPI0020A31840|nr:DUF397 domain-containing protein [Actinomadura rupiterrae]MCP2343566.1 hypothetical protein [Actinomadura rupiterrae]
MNNIPLWRKSSYSAGGGDDCVEVADLGRAIGLRDSKDPHGPDLRMSRNAWAELLRTVSAIG